VRVTTRSGERAWASPVFARPGQPAIAPF
jgi:hypothetical protein